MARTKRQEYEEKRENLMRICENCRKNSTIPISIDRCNYHCNVGKRARWLEVEYSDVTGWGHDWSHKKWY